MKLSDMQKDKCVRVKSLGVDAHFLNRITSIGITEGTMIRVIRNDRKMPVLVYVRQTLLALNREDCAKIEIEEVA